MTDDVDDELDDTEILQGVAQAALPGCKAELDWEARASQPAAVVARTTDCRFALAALATSPVCSLQKKLEKKEELEKRRGQGAQDGVAQNAPGSVSLLAPLYLMAENKNISSVKETVVPSDLMKTYLSSSNGKKDSLVPAANAEVS